MSVLSDNSSFPNNHIMTLNSKEYSKGIIIKARLYEAFLVYNLNGQYSSLKAKVGVDDRYMDSLKDLDVSFYIDDKLIKTIHLEKGDLPKDININLNKGLQLKIVLSKTEDNKYVNFVDMILE